MWLSAVLVGVTAAFNVLGGLGTTCVALFAERFGESMAPLVPYKWLYLLFVAGGVATGVWEACTIGGMVGRREKAFVRCALSLSAGALVAGGQAGSSLLLRGAAAPADMRLYLTLATLAVVLSGGGLGAFRARGDGAAEPSDGVAEDAGGAALLAAGALALVAPALVRATHVLAGADHSAAFGATLPLVGCALVLAGAVTIGARISDRRHTVGRM